MRGYNTPLFNLKHTDMTEQLVYIGYSPKENGEFTIYRSSKRAMTQCKGKIRLFKEYWNGSNWHYEPLNTKQQ